MKKIKVGIPRALMYYQENIFWQKFLKKLNCKVVIGPPVDKNIIELGNKYISNETCLSYKAYLGEIAYLENICDYLLITSINNYGKYKACPKLKITYDSISSIICKERVMLNDINYKKMKYNFFESFKIALKISKNPIRIISSYLIARKKQQKYNITKELENNNKLNKSGAKVLIISEFYNLETPYITGKVLNILKQNEITYLRSNYLDNKLSLSFSEYFCEELKLKYESEAIGSLYYYQYQIDGVILLSTKYCEANYILYNTLAMRKNRIPIINITIDENNYDKQLLSFIDKIKRENVEK